MMVDDRGEFSRLAEQCEKATGPDRELDALIHVALGRAGSNIVALKTGWCAGSDSDLNPIRSPAYTASIDAALTLVPDGWMLLAISDFMFDGMNGARLVDCEDNSAESFGTSNNALALCAAALRARSNVAELQGDK